MSRAPCGRGRGTAGKQGCSVARAQKADLDPSRGQHVLKVSSGYGERRGHASPNKIQSVMLGLGSGQEGRRSFQGQRGTHAVTRGQKGQRAPAGDPGSSTLTLGCSPAGSVLPVRGLHPQGQSRHHRTASQTVWGHRGTTTQLDSGALGKVGRTRSKGHMTWSEDRRRAPERLGGTVGPGVQGTGVKGGFWEPLCLSRCQAARKN